MAPRHQRFSLSDVTFAGVPMPGATIDAWEDRAGGPRWSARIVTRSSPGVDVGELCGRTIDGRTLTGQALVADRQLGAHGRHEIVVVFHGIVRLHDPMEA